MFVNTIMICKFYVYLIIQICVVSGMFQTTFCQEEILLNVVCQTPDERTGICIFIKDCETMNDSLKTLNALSQHYLVNVLNPYLCGFDGDEAKICCPSTSNNIVKPKEMEKRFRRTSQLDVTRHENLKLLPKNCGYLDHTDKILGGGIDAALKEFPWMALLSYKTDTGREFKCGGTIITDRYILTAAHCITNLDDPLIGVRIGEHNILTEMDSESLEDGTRISNEPVQELEIEEIIPHPDFNKFNSDIGLIRVTRMNLTVDSARPVCLPLDSSKSGAFRHAVATGWGLTSSGGKPSAVLQRIDLPIVDLDECRNFYRSYWSVSITNEHLCAGGTGTRYTCSGDSGGPLQVVTYVGGEIKYVQQGIVAFGPRFCELKGAPGVYTRVDSFMDWILDNIKP